MTTLLTRSLPSTAETGTTAAKPTHHHHEEDDDDCLQLRSSSPSSSPYLPSHAAIVTIRSILLIGLAMYGLHCSEAFQHYYAAFYTSIVIPYGGHRMSEPILAVVSFSISGVLFSAIKACGFKKMKPALSSKNEHAVTSSSVTSTDKTSATSSSPTSSSSSPSESSIQAAITALFEGGGDFVFWGLVINGGVYLLLIDVSQRIAEHELRHLSLIQQAPIDPPSILRLVSETVFSVWAYDFLFYFIHRSFHAAGSNTGVVVSSSSSSQVAVQRVRRWWNSLHLPHHDHYTQGHKPLRPMITFHHHILDASAQVGINILVQQIPLQWVAMCVVYPLIFIFSGLSSLLLMPVTDASSSSFSASSNISSFNVSSSSAFHNIVNVEDAMGADGGVLSTVYFLVLLLPTTRHTLSKLMHNIVVTYLLVEAHSGYDLPFQSHRVFPSIFGGAVRHQIHHGTGRKYFHQFFMYMDDAMGPLKA